MADTLSADIKLVSNSSRIISSRQFVHSHQSAHSFLSQQRQVLPWLLCAFLFLHELC